MTILINDLQQNLELDSRAMAGVRGGYSMYSNQMHTIMPYEYDEPKGWGPGVPSNFNMKSLTNINKQLNLAVGSANVIQSNSNSVMQF